MASALHAAERDVALQSPTQYESWAAFDPRDGVTPDSVDRLFGAALGGLPSAERAPLLRLHARYVAAGRVYLRLAQRGRSVEAASAARHLAPPYLALAGDLDAGVRRQTAAAGDRLEQIRWLNTFLRLLAAVGLPLVMLAVGGTVYAQRRLVHAERVLLRAELQRLRAGSAIDSVTGLGNDHSFVIEIHREVARSRRHGVTVALALIDADRFADTVVAAGAGGGDRVLAALAGMLQGRRVEDRSFRLQGGQFALLLPGTTAREVWPLMEELRRRAEDSDWGSTVSIGIADLSLGVDSVEGLRSRAEAALLEARRQGRNSVVAYAVRQQGEVRAAG